MQCTWLARLSCCGRRRHRGQTWGARRRAPRRRTRSRLTHSILPAVSVALYPLCCIHCVHFVPSFLPSFRTMVTMYVAEPCRVCVTATALAVRDACGKKTLPMIQCRKMVTTKHLHRQITRSPGPPGPPWPKWWPVEHKLYKIKMARHLSSICVLMSDPGTERCSGAQKRLESHK